MKSNINPLFPDKYYHIYNRGNNGETIFKEEKNYKYFLDKYIQYIHPIANTYAYCLLKNHFHFLIQIKTEEEIKEFYKNKTKAGLNKTQTGFETLSALESNFSNLISKQFSNLFNGYSQGINKAFNRTGVLFETPFRRIEVNSDTYFSQLVWYIHFNPQKHGLATDFRDYPHSSYHSFLNTKATKLQREQVLNWFGGENEYKKFHQLQFDEKRIEKLVIEF